MRENGWVSLYRDDGIVLRTHKLGEADRIISILTRRNGRIRAVAKGVRRTRSRFGARLEPFTHVDLLLYTGRSLDVITQAETVRPYGEPLAADYPRYTSGTAMLETAERFTPVEKEPLIRQFLLLVGGLRALGEGEHDPRLVLDAYLLRTLAVAGYAPALDECAVCGSADPGGDPPEPPDRRFAPNIGSASTRLTAGLASPPRSGPDRTSFGAGRRADLPVLPAARGGDPRGGDHSADARAAPRRLGTGRRQPAPAPGRVQRPGRGVRAVAPGTLDPFASSRGACVSKLVRPPYPHPDGLRPPAIPADLVPRHVALVMDGNGRWAKQRGLPRTEGHKMGEAALFDVIMGAIELGIPYLSAYAFSTENWRRSPDEVRFLMGFNRDVIRRRRDQLNEVGVRVRWACRWPGCGAASSRSWRSPSR